MKLFFNSYTKWKTKWKSENAFRIFQKAGVLFNYKN